MENTTSNAQFKGKDSHIQNDRIKFQKNNGTLSIPLYNSKDKDIGLNPSGYLPFVTPQGIKYIPVYNTNYGSSGSRGPVSKLSSVNGKACNLCFSNCNKNYSNYDDCNAMCDCTCNQCDSCVGCDGCNDCHSCNGTCNETCYGCQDCQKCDDGCNGNCNGSCYGGCDECVGCNECESCDYCEAEPGGCYTGQTKCVTCDTACQACDGAEGCRGGCYGPSNCKSGNCTEYNGICCIGSCDSCDSGHACCDTNTITEPCSDNYIVTTCGNSECWDATCDPCDGCESCQSCNSGCNSGCNGDCNGCQGCNSCHDKCNNPGCNSCNSCNECQICVECQTCVGCQSCDSECYEENADYNRTCETWYAGSRRTLNK